MNSVGVINLLNISEWFLYIVLLSLHLIKKQSTLLVILHGFAWNIEIKFVNFVS